MVTDRQIRVYSALLDLFLRLVLTIIASVIFVLFSVKLLRDPSWPMAAADGFLSMTLGAMFKYYFWRPGAPSPKKRS
jgi:hypothetical protein